MILLGLVDKLFIWRVSGQDEEHCETMMSGDFEEIGVGRYELRRWTLYLATPE